KGTIPDIERVAWKRRKVIILFDVNVKDNGNVQAARWVLTKELRTRGAEVLWFAWPKETPPEVNGVDDLVGLWCADKVLELIQSHSRPVKLTAADFKSSPREFCVVAEDHYRLSLPALDIVFDMDRLRRERHELVGELSVHCGLPGTRTLDGTLSIA